MIKSISTEVQGLFILDAEPYYDERGLFRKIFTKEDFINAHINFIPCESYYSINNKNVIRGMHFQAPPYDHDKIVYVMQGRITDVCLDLRTSSSTYGKHFSIELDSIDSKYLFIPRGVAHGFLSLDDNSVVHYMQNSVYSKEHDLGVLYHSFGYRWEVDKPLVSRRDLSFPSFADLPEIFF